MNTFKEFAKSLGLTSTELAQEVNSNTVYMFRLLDPDYQPYRSNEIIFNELIENMRKLNDDTQRLLDAQKEREAFIQDLTEQFAEKRRTEEEARKKYKRSEQL